MSGNNLVSLSWTIHWTISEETTVLLDPESFYGGWHRWLCKSTNYRVNLLVQPLRLENDYEFLLTLWSSGVDLDMVWTPSLTTFQANSQFPEPGHLHSDKIHCRRLTSKMVIVWNNAYYYCPPVLTLVQCYQVWDSFIPAVAYAVMGYLANCQILSLANTLPMCVYTSSPSWLLMTIYEVFKLQLYNIAKQAQRKLPITLFQIGIKL